MMVMSITSSCWLELVEMRCVGVGPSRIPPIAWLPPQRLPPDGGLPRRAVGSPTPEKGVRGGVFIFTFCFLSSSYFCFVSVFYFSLPPPLSPARWVRQLSRMCGCRLVTGPVSECVDAGGRPRGTWLLRSGVGGGSAMCRDDNPSG